MADGWLDGGWKRDALEKVEVIRECQVGLTAGSTRRRVWCWPMGLHTDAGGGLAARWVGGRCERNARSALSTGWWTRSSGGGGRYGVSMSIENQTVRNYVCEGHKID